MLRMAEAAEACRQQDHYEQARESQDDLYLDETRLVLSQTRWASLVVLSGRLFGLSTLSRRVRIRTARPVAP